VSAKANQSRLAVALLALPIAGLLALIVAAVCIVLAFTETQGCATTSATGNVKGVP
jgi:hypothetical protein